MYQDPQELATAHGTDNQAPHAASMAMVHGPSDLQQELVPDGPVMAPQQFDQPIVLSCTFTSHCDAAGTGHRLNRA